METAMTTTRGSHNWKWKEKARNDEKCSGQEVKSMSRKHGNMTNEHAMQDTANNLPACHNASVKC